MLAMFATIVHTSFNINSKANRCLEKSCLACNVVPPAVPLPIKNLCSAFCKVADSNLTDEKLKAKEMSAPGGKRNAANQKSQSPSGKAGPKDGLKKKKKNQGSSCVFVFLVVCYMLVSQALYVLLYG